MTDDFRIIELLKELIYERLGIHFSNEKNYLIESKLNKMLSKNDFKDLKSFYDSLINGDKESFEILVRYITTGHTFFFREAEHFKILADIIKAKNKEKSVIWCAACSTGEEVYSIIISLLESGIYNFMILASDINKNVLYKLKEGVYQTDKLQDVEKSIMLKYFSKSGGDKYKITEDLKKYIIIKKINLIDDFVFERKVDYIFCRNVMIYFDEDTRKKTINNLLTNLKDDGYLFIGHSENLFNITDKVESCGVAVYNKKRET